MVRFIPSDYVKHLISDDIIMNCTELGYNFGYYVDGILRKVYYLIVINNTRLDLR